MLGLDTDTSKSNNVSSHKNLNDYEAERERWRNELVPNLSILNVHVRSRV